MIQTLVLKPVKLYGRAKGYALILTIVIVVILLVGNFATAGKMVRLLCENAPASWRSSMPCYYAPSTSNASPVGVWEVRITWTDCPNPSKLQGFAVAIRPDNSIAFVGNPDRRRQARNGYGAVSQVGAARFQYDICEAGQGCWQNQLHGQLSYQKFSGTARSVRGGEALCSGHFVATKM